MRINPDLYADLIQDIADLAKNDSKYIMGVALSGKHLFTAFKNLVCKANLVYIRNCPHYDNSQILYFPYVVEITLVSA